MLAKRVEPGAEAEPRDQDLAVEPRQAPRHVVRIVRLEPRAPHELGGYLSGRAVRARLATELGTTSAAGGRTARERLVEDRRGVG